MKWNFEVLNDLQPVDKSLRKNWMMRLNESVRNDFVLKRFFNECVKNCTFDGDTLQRNFAIWFNENIWKHVQQA